MVDIGWSTSITVIVSLCEVGFLGWFSLVEDLAWTNSLLRLLGRVIQIFPESEMLIIVALLEILPVVQFSAVAVGSQIGVVGEALQAHGSVSVYIVP